ncbi:MAG: hypothetical protein K4H23_01535 [Mollicutes bacterium PWAP]|nr:hypothetical protein [Mollicutes bacterium PWAP]
MIDFTDDIMIATWFALTGQIVVNKKNAAIYILEANKEKFKEEISNFEEKNLIYKSPYISNRAIAQKSYFLLDNQNGNENEEIYKITISYKSIKEIVKYLKNKTHKSVFPDLKGIVLEKINNSFATYFLEAFETKNFEKKYYYLKNL